VQALDPKALTFLGRGHDRGEAMAAIKLSRELFSRTSFDLIYARPGQSVVAWLRELDEALALAGDHLSLYQLTIEPGTAFHTRAAKGEFAVLDEEDAAALFELTQERLAAHGMPAYEISNHARPGAECRHNLAYWRYEDYLGIGPGAHGRVTRSGIKYATRHRRLPEAWLKQPEFEEMGPITRETAVEEMVMMGLRLTEGISRARFEELAECDTETLFGIGLARLIDGGFIKLDKRRLVATVAGRQRLNAVLAMLFG
jgi:coproporphyrinogen III oxidase-like Fe-S oxidoreductase